MVLLAVNVFSALFFLNDNKLISERSVPPLPRQRSCRDQVCMELSTHCKINEIARILPPTCGRTIVITRIDISNAFPRPRCYGEATGLVNCSFLCLRRRRALSVSSIHLMARLVFVHTLSSYSHTKPRHDWDLNSGFQGCRPSVLALGRQPWGHWGHNVAHMAYKTLYGNH